MHKTSASSLDPVHAQEGLNWGAHWEHLRTLVAVLEHGSLSRAAQHLGMAQPTLGRHIAALEAHWRAPLFTRTTQGLQPTEAALALYPLAQGMRDQARALERVAEGWSGARLQGTVRLTASDVIGSELLPPLLADLQHQHPGIRLELVLDNRSRDVLRREVDIAIRMHAPTQPTLLAQRVGTMPVQLYAHARYLALHGHPQVPEDLRHHRLIGFDAQSHAVPAAFESLWQRGHFALRCDDGRAQWALVRAGAGIAPLACWLARTDPALVPLLTQEVRLALDVWLCMHEDLRRSPLHRTVLQALHAGLSARLASDLNDPDAPTLVSASVPASP